MGGAVLYAGEYAGSGRVEVQRVEEEQFRVEGGRRYVGRVNCASEELRGNVRIRANSESLVYSYEYTACS